MYYNYSKLNLIYERIKTLIDFMKICKVLIQFFTENNQFFYCKPLSIDLV